MTNFRLFLRKIAFDNIAETGKSACNKHVLPFPCFVLYQRSELSNELIKFDIYKGLQLG